MEHHIKTLISQNHIIDLLEIGLTYPIRNLPVWPQNKKVAFGETTFIEIDSSEPGVIYELHNEDEEPFPGQPRIKTGNGKKLEIETPPINDKTHFKVLATKKSGDKTLSTYLIPLNPLIVQVGLDEGIEIRLKDGTDTYDYNSKVKVEIPLSQEGVLYVLTDGKSVLLSDPVLGNRSAITLTTIALAEDIQIIVKGVKPANPGNPPPINKWEDLDTKLPSILIRPNTNLEVRLGTELPLNFNSAFNVEVGNTQKSANYQVFLYNLLDEDYVHNRPERVDGPDILTIKPTGFSNVKIKLPSLPENWDAPAPFQKAGNIRTGTDGNLSISVAKQKEDVLVVILAEKKDTGLRGIVQTKPAVLIKPDTSLTLKPENTPVPAGQQTTIRVRSSQPGIIYQLRNQANTKNIGNPGYHHKNKGLGIARIGLDLVVDTFEDTFTIMQTNKLNTTTEFRVKATKATSSIHAMMDQPVTVAVNP